jgi:predicted CXXCH cytochrome family protein
VKKQHWLQLLAYFVLIISQVGFMLGCDRYARYRALYTVFDGVPHPDEKIVKPREAELAVILEGGQLDKTKAFLPPPQYKHPAADAKDECSFCHGPLYNMVTPPKDMCLKCHTQVKENLAYIHGPAALDCVVCHDVHKSPTKTLVTKTGNPLCFICHYSENKDKLREAEAHKELEEDNPLCISCHDPHGGRDRYFLKKENV